MERFLIRTYKIKDENLSVTNQVKEFLESKGKTVFVDLMEDLRINKDRDNENLYEKFGRPEVIISLGGDGTMLGTARDFMDSDVALLGVNLGSLGYLTEVEKDNVILSLEKLVSGDFEIEERMMLEGYSVKDGIEGDYSNALNDIAVMKSNPTQAIGLNIYVNGKFLKDYNADGIIVSTPTGSTGYNLSAGGPIVEPSADLLLLTPVSPHTLMARSIILSSKDEIRIELKGEKNGVAQTAFVSADSASKIEMVSGDSFVVKKSNMRTKIIKISSLSFLEVLHRKLS